MQKKCNYPFKLLRLASATCLWCIGETRTTEGSRDNMQTPHRKSPRRLMYAVMLRNDAALSTKPHLTLATLYFMTKTNLCDLQRNASNPHPNHELHVKKINKKCYGASLYTQHRCSISGSHAGHTTTKKLCCHVPLPSHNNSNKVGEAR